MAKGIAQLVKPTKMPLRYPCIICSSSKHCDIKHPRKIEVQTMFQTKPNIIAIIVAKNLKPNNVVVNVVAIITTHSQTPKQQVLREGELVKAKTTID